MDLEYHDRPQEGFSSAFIAVAAGATLAVIAATVAYVSGINVDLDSAEVTSALVREASDRKAIKPCDFTIVQYGAYHEPRKTECAKGGDLPNHILTLPVGK